MLSFYTRPLCWGYFFGRNLYGRRSKPPKHLNRHDCVNFKLHIVPLWVNGNRNLHPSAPLGLLFRAEYVGASLEAPGNLSQNNRVNFNLYAVTLWANGAMGKVLGRLKRRPYEFCLYVVLLWVNSASGFCPSAPMGLLLSIVTKVTKRTLLRLRRKKESK